MSHRKSVSVLITSCALAGALASTIAMATDDTLEEIVVTAVARPVNRLESSISTSSINIADADSLAPRSTQELLRSLPGIRSESSGGEGNANVTVRGIPLSTGGSKYVQYQEDGLPVLLFGDLNFANSDNFVRADWSVARIESIRGGSASTFTTGAPGAVINFISNDGSTEGGAIGVSYGLDYHLFRTDFMDGGKLNDQWTYAVGGFYHSGEGQRHTGFNGEQGGQVKITLTKQLEGGYLKLHMKHLDDSVPTYMPTPMLYQGGKVGNPPNFDLAKDSLYSPYNSSVSSFDAFGNAVQRDVSKGINSKVDAFGFEFDKDVGNGWHINDKFRTAKVGGSWIAPFSDSGSGGNALSAGRSLCAGSTLADGVTSLNNCGTARVTYAAGPNAGQNYNGLYFNDLMFDVTFKDVGNTVNDFRISKSLFDDALSVTAGYFMMHQNVAIDWNAWQFSYQSLERNPVPLNVTTSGPDGVFGNADDQKVTSNGLYWPGLLSWSWDLKYDATAPYINLGGKIDRFNWDVSLRRDRLEARGVAYRICCGNTGGFDFNRDGNIEPWEARGLASATQAAPTDRLNYNSSHTSYSLGGSYLLDNNMSVFARLSDGVSFPADRLIQVTGSLNADGSLTNGTSGYDEVKQLEAGFKWTQGRTAFYATLFHTLTDETNADITTSETFQRRYKADGVELEGSWRGGSGVGVNGNFTYMDAKIDKDKLDPTLNGARPRRQAPYIFTVTPNYRADKWEVGLTAQGSGSYHLGTVANGTANLTKQNAYVLFNLYGSVSLSDSLSASLSVNNLTDELVATEAEEGTATVGSYIRGRVLTGRTTNLALKYKF